MTLYPTLVQSWVTIDLDTTPPLLVFDAPTVVEPPDDWIVILRANEDLGPVGMEFIDSLEVVSRIGFERVNSRTLAVRIPSETLASGTGELKVVARDRACNAVTLITHVNVLRPRAFDVDFTIDTGQQVRMSLDGAFQTDLDVNHGFDVAPGLDHAYEVVTEMTGPYDVTLEMD